MWIVLAGTVGLAAVVDRQVSRTRGGELAPPVSLADAKVRLPKGWVVAEDDDSMIEVHESGDDEMGRQLRVKIGPPSSLIESLRALTDDATAEGSIQSMKITIGGQSGTLVVRKRPIDRGIYLVQISAASIIPPGNRKLTIQLQEIGEGRKPQIQSDIDLVKRVAASVVIEQQ